MSKMMESFPVLHVKGSHFDVGHSTGSTFQNRIRTYIQKSDLLQDCLLPFYESPDGRQLVESVLAITQKTFPQYVEEIKGTAEGAGLPFETLFINNMQFDIYYGFSRKKPKHTKEDLGCSTLFLNRPDVKVIGHNEDGEFLFDSTGYFLDATVLEDGNEKEGFTALCVPGCLPGNAMAFNKHGLVFSVNGVVCPVTVETTPADMVCRAMLAAANIDEVKKILTNSGTGSSMGFSVNVGSVVDTSSQWSVEVFPDLHEAKVHVKEIRESEDPDASTYIHLNEYRHTDVEFETYGTSVHRMKRMLDLPLPTCARDVRRILGDGNNERYPIYRTPRPTDDAYTLCTGIFDLLGRTYDVYFANPDKESKPLLTFRI